MGLLLLFLSAADSRVSENPIYMRTSTYTAYPQICSFILRMMWMLVECAMISHDVVGVK